MEKIEKIRCSFVKLNNPAYVKYHDEEWCRKTYDENYIYEMFLLETFQAGLSWECILNKRENFRSAYDGFDINKIIKYDDKKISELAENSGIIRNKAKIKASIENSKIYYEIKEKYNGFYNFIYSVIGFERIYEDINITRTEYSDKLSKELKKLGMKFVGSITIFSYLQSIGFVNSHEKQCFLHE